jgi:hypothetical protein
VADLARPGGGAEHDQTKARNQARSIFPEHGMLLFDCLSAGSVGGGRLRV